MAGDIKIGRSRAAVGGLTPSASQRPKVDRFFRSAPCASLCGCSPPRTVSIFNFGKALPVAKLLHEINLLIGPGRAPGYNLQITVKNKHEIGAISPSQFFIYDLRVVCGCISQADAPTT
jgi:hypothetical protein